MVNPRRTLRMLLFGGGIAFAIVFLFHWYGNFQLAQHGKSLEKVALPASHEQVGEGEAILKHKNGYFYFSALVLATDDSYPQVLEHFRQETQPESTFELAWWEGDSAVLQLAGLADAPEIFRRASYPFPLQNSPYGSQFAAQINHLLGNGRNSKPGYHHYLLYGLTECHNPLLYLLY